MSANYTLCPAGGDATRSPGDTAAGAAAGGGGEMPDAAGGNETALGRVRRQSATAGVKVAAQGAGADGRRARQVQTLSVASCSLGVASVLLFKFACSSRVVAGVDMLFGRIIGQQKQAFLRTDPGMKPSAVQHNIHGHLTYSLPSTCN